MVVVVVVVVVVKALDQETTFIQSVTRSNLQRSRNPVGDEHWL